MFVKFLTAFGCGAASTMGSVGVLFAISEILRNEKKIRRVFDTVKTEFSKPEEKEEKEEQ